MKNTQARSFISLPSQPTLSAIAMILISTCISVSALASPITQGDPLSASLGWEVDMGSARDPGDRDGSMGGRASGPSLGIQWWYRDWLAAEGRFSFQSDEGGLGTHEYENNAWRLGAGVRFALPKLLSPHLSIGLAYDRFRSEWAVPKMGDQSQGRGVDQLSGIAGTAEIGLSATYSGWALGVHLGGVIYLTADKESRIESWIEGTGSVTRDTSTAWAQDDQSFFNINLGVRLSRSF